MQIQVHHYQDLFLIELKFNQEKNKKKFDKTTKYELNLNAITSLAEQSNARNGAGSKTPLKKEEKKRLIYIFLIFFV